MSQHDSGTASGMAPSVLSGIERIPSTWTFGETVERFKNLLSEKGIRLFALIDHAAEAGKVAMSLRPTLVLIFGSPRAGTRLMQSEQSMALDLPLRVLITEGEYGEVWISYHRLKSLTKRHGIENNDSTIESMDANLMELIQVVAQTKNS